MTRSHLHKIIIPKVPDRGGRTGGLNLILELAYFCNYL